MSSRAPRPGPVIVVDTREQLPWAFSYETIRATMAVGDYCLKGYEQGLVVERKSLDDLINSLTWDRDRFERELAKSPYYALCVICEGSWDDVFAGNYRSRASPRSISASITALQWRYSVPVFLAGSRQAANRLCQEMLVRAWKDCQAEARRASASSFVN
jgi:DNA excision repair protein ERCC-4